MEGEPLAQVDEILVRIGSLDDEADVPVLRAACRAFTACRAQH
jgi:hypothetical protein